VIQELKKINADDIPVLGGGVIPDDDIPALKDAGISNIFTPGTPLEDILNAFKRESGMLKEASEKSLEKFSFELQAISKDKAEIEAALKAEADLLRKRIDILEGTGSSQTKEIATLKKELILNEESKGENFIVYYPEAKRKTNRKD